MNGKGHRHVRLAPRLAEDPPPVAVGAGAVLRRAERQPGEERHGRAGAVPAQHRRRGLSALAGALFIAPYILLSATAGKLADRFPKPRVVLVYKLAEVLLMAAAAAAFLTESVPACWPC